MKKYLARFMSWATSEKTKFAALKVSLTLACMTVVGMTIGFKTAEWDSRFRLHFQTPVEVKFQPPVWVEEKEFVFAVVEPVYASEELNEKKISALCVGEVREEICRVWGEKALVGLAICSAESGCRKDAIHVNSNGSVDFSVFQINSIHADRFGLEGITNWKQNISNAYKLFQEQGKTPWVVTHNGSYERALVQLLEEVDYAI